MQLLNRLLIWDIVSHRQAVFVTRSKPKGNFLEKNNEYKAKEPCCQEIQSIYSHTKENMKRIV